MTKDFCGNQYRRLGEDDKDHVYCKAHLRQGRMPECTCATKEEALDSKNGCNYQPNNGNNADKSLNGKNT